MEDPAKQVVDLPGAERRILQHDLAGGLPAEVGLGRVEEPPPVLVGRRHVPQHAGNLDQVPRRLRVEGPHFRRTPAFPPRHGLGPDMAEGPPGFDLGEAEQHTGPPKLLRRDSFDSRARHLTLRLRLDVHQVPQQPFVVVQ